MTGYIFVLLLCIFFVLPPTLGKFKAAVNCINCLDPEGNNCDDRFRRYGKTKYWILKGTSEQSFAEATTACRSVGFDIAQLTNEAEARVFGALSVNAGHKSYWAGIRGDDGKINPIVVNQEGISESKDGQHATVCQYPPGHACTRKANVGKDKVLDDSDCPEPEFEDNKFIRTGPNSKFLYPRDKLFVSWDASKYLCEATGLELASIATMMDYFYLKDDFVKKNRLNERNKKPFYASLSGKSNDGDFTDVNTGRSMPVQLFSIIKSKGKDGCSALEAYEGVVQFSSIPCKNTNFMPLCQYKKGSECYLKSPLSVYEQEEKDELIPIGSTGKRIFAGSRKQKTWLKAAKFCARHKMKLLDFIKNDTLETALVWPLIGKYQKLINYPYTIGKSWTSAVFKDGFREGGTFTFESTGETWTYEESLKHFEWLTDNVRNERCAVIAVTKAVRPVMCNQANFFLCYKVEPLMVVEATTEVRIKSRNKGSEEPEDTEVVTMKPSTCKSDPIKISFAEDGFTAEEVINLISLSENLNFSKGYSPVLKIKEETIWRIAHVKAMGKITKHICPSPWISQDYINILMNFIMIYYNSVPEKERSTFTQKTWQTMVTRYKKCLNNSDPFEFLARGGMIIKVANDDNDIVLIKESVDNDKFALDYILEGLWYMFQVTVGACYNLAKWKTTWLAEFFYAFKLDFTEHLQNWWISPGANNYGLLFGDIDLYANLYNLRACAVSTFQKLGILDRLPVRPLLVDHTSYWTKNMNSRMYLT